MFVKDVHRALEKVSAGIIMPAGSGLATFDITKPGGVGQNSRVISSFV